MIVYSTGCPKCRILVKKFQQANITFQLVEDENEVMRVAKEYNIMEAPFVIKDGKLYNFMEALKLV